MNNNGIQKADTLLLLGLFFQLIAIYVNNANNKSLNSINKVLKTIEKKGTLDSINIIANHVNGGAKSE